MREDSKFNKLKDMDTFTLFVDSNKVDQHPEGEVGIWTLFKLFTKSVYSTTAGAVVIIFSPMLVALGLAAMFPIHISVGAAQVFVTLLSAGVLWGMTYFSIRRTTFYKNLTITSVNVIKVYLSIYFTMLFVTFISECSFWTTTIILDWMNLNSVVSTLFGFVSENTNEMNWIKVDWFTLVYTWIGSVTLMFLACFATRSIFRTEATFFLILITYILLLIPFGGILPPSIENFHYENGHIVLDKDFTFIVGMSFLFPQYHLNLFNYVAVWSGTLTDGLSMAGMVWFSAFKWSSSWMWDFTILMPLMSGVCLLVISLLTIKY